MIEELFTIDDIKEAYNKLKRYYYYDGENYVVRRKIAEFEYDNNELENKLKKLKSYLNDYDNKQNNNIEKIFGEISYYVLPKSFEKEQDVDDVDDKEHYKKNNGEENNGEEKGIIITNRFSSETENQLKEYNFFIDIPIELHIINVLWILKLGYLLDSKLGDKITCCYANRLEFDKEHKKIKKGKNLFKPYFIQYQKWRDNCINNAEKLLKDKKNIIICSLDIKRYYPSARVDYENIKEDLEKICEKKQYERYKFLTDIISQIRKKYINSIEEIKDDTKEQANIPSEQSIPIGMLSSSIVANWYLRKVDKKIKEKLHPYFYGRYVDDMLIVFENNKNIKKLNIKKIIANYFEDIITDQGNDYRIEVDNKETLLIIQKKKVKLFVFDSNSTTAMFQKFKDTIRKHSSEFRFLPEEDRLQNEFVQEVYSIDYSDTMNKLRSIENIHVDKFKMSCYLAKHLKLSLLSCEKSNFNKTKEELMFMFRGTYALGLCNYWEKILIYFIANKDTIGFYDFINKMKKCIDRIIYDDSKSIKKRITTQLKKYLKEAVCSALSLNSQFLLDLKKDKYCIFDLLDITEQTLIKNIEQLLKSYMIKHKYCFLPILTYCHNLKDINYLSNNITDFQKYDFSEYTEEDYMYNPKFISVGEIMLYQYYFSIYNEKGSKENICNIVDFFQETKDLYKKLNGKNLACDEDLIKKQENYNKNGSYNKIKFESKNKIHLNKLIIGIYNIEVSDREIEDNLSKKYKLSDKEVQKYIKLLNLSIENKKCDIIVFPEISIPYQMLPLLQEFSKKHNIVIICGLKHILVNNIVYNLIATILPINFNNMQDSFINLRLKKWYSPLEEKEIRKYHNKLPKDINPKIENNLENNLFCYNNLYFAIYDCFELADIKFRAEMKSHLDLLVACEWNKDIEYFDNIIKSTSRDLHCYIVQVNTSQFGCSKIIAPAKTENMTKLNITGGYDNILIGEVNVEELRNFQRKDTLYLSNKDQIFKPLPPDFDKDTDRLKI